MQPNQERARTTLAELFNQYKQLTPEQRNMVSEADVIQKFIERLLGEVLGWPIHDLALYRKEVQAKVGRPDIVLYESVRTSIEKRPLIYVEAKRFGLIDQLQDATKTTVQALKPYQLSLPGMATDRTKEEQQAINYAFQNNGEWAILTNYERLRLFNARRDWVVVSFEQPEAYLDDFDTLWQLSYENILNGSLDRLSNQRYIANIDSEYLQLINNWRERLANDLIANEHENTWLRQNGFLNVAQLRHVVQRVLDRLVVIRFAEDHYVLPAGGLRQISEIFNVIPIYTFSMDEHLSFFFRSFDRRHNSALFAKDIADQARFTDATLLELVADLYKARYRAMPADILGNTYEQFLGKTLVLTPEGNLATRDNLETRKKQGSYYTSTPLVRHLVDNSLGRYLYATENGRPDGTPLPNETPKKIEDIHNLRILDAACGSGSFLISVYYILADFYRREITRIEQTMLDTQQRLLRENATQFKIQLEIAPYQHQLENLENYPRLILERHLYGVDLDPQAAEIAVVNMMMRSLENRNKDITKIHHIPLLLNQNIKVGNSLVGAPAYDPRLSAYPTELASLIRLRAELVAIDHNLPRHDDIVAELATLRATLYSALEPTYRDHFTNLERVHLFHWGIEFPEVFYRADGTPNPEGGFQVVVGNPPWEILKPEIREYYAQFDPNIESKYKRAKVEQVIEELNDTRPDIQQGWQHLQSLLLENGAYFKASPDYTHQGRGDTALHKLFIERVFGLLAHNGRLGYLVPSGIYSHRGTQPLREWLFQESQIEYLYGLANVRKFFPDVDSRFKFTLLGLKKGGQTERFKTLFLISHAECPHTISEANASTVM